MSTVLYVQDFDPFSHPGGAEQNDRAVIVEGIRRGHDIRISLPPQVDLNGVDLAIISNATSYPPPILQGIVERVPTVWHIHDYFPSCHFRLFYPLADRCLNRCPLTASTEQMLTKADLLVFLSPLHRQAWLKKHNNLEPIPYHLHPSPVDPRPYEKAAAEVAREPGTVLGVNSLAEFKGRDNVLKYAQEHPELRFTFIGDEDVPMPPNCARMARVPNSQMPMLMARHEFLVHLPSSPMPFDRVIPEAVFAGCKLIANDLIGALSWNWNSKEEMKKAVTESPRLFWEKVEEAVKA